MATADVESAESPPSRAPGTFKFQSSASSAQPSSLPGTVGSTSVVTTENSEGDDEKQSEGSRDDSSRIRGGYRCSKCGLPKKGHVCPSGSGTYTNLTFVGDRETREIVTMETEQDRRASLLRRVGFLESELERVTKENLQLRAALEALQASQGVFPYLTYPLQTVTPPIVNSTPPDPREPTNDYDSQPFAKRPRFDSESSLIHDYTSHSHPPHIALSASNQACNMDAFYDSSRMNLPVNTHVGPDSPKPAKSAFVTYQSPNPIPAPHFLPNSSLVAQETLPLHSPPAHPYTPVNVAPRTGSSEHAWLRIPKPQGRPN